MSPQRPAPSPLSDPQHLEIPAGDFLSWLEQTREALKHDTGPGADVDCRDCTGCCSSSYFIHIRPEEKKTLQRINKKLLVPAPGLPKGHVLMGYGRDGVCPMLLNNQCSIYADRPQTCRNFDCRVFAASGIAAGDEKGRISQRVRHWRFSYPTPQDRAAHRAVQAAAQFIRDNASSFPGGRVPSNPSQLTVLALKAYTVFMPDTDGSAGSTSDASPEQLAQAIVETCRRFDEEQGLSV